jgi:hypothetical protein
LFEIWNELHQLLPDLPMGVGYQYELDAEHDVIFGNPQVVKLIRSLRSGGGRIIFISDTYLPRKFVLDELCRHGAALPSDPCYVSSEEGVAKFTGNLFKHVLKREDISADQLRHLGDNERSDLANPTALGIKASRCTDAQFNTWERAVSRVKFHDGEPKVALGAVMRAARLSTSHSASDRSAQRLVATFLGPVLTAWVSWVLKMAVLHGVQRLYFVSRDGYLAWHAARVLGQKFGGVECRYLKISRQSIYLPTVEAVSPEGIPWLHKSWEIAELKRLLAKLELDWLDVAPAFVNLAGGHGPNKIIHGEREWAQFWDGLQRAEVSRTLLSRATERREQAVAYLKQEGLYDRVPMAIVDLGWHANVQACLRKLLGSCKAFLRGYYLGLAADRAPPSESGPTDALFYAVPGDRIAIAGQHAVFKNATILEHVLGMAPHGTVARYCIRTGHVDAVCAPTNEDHRRTLVDVAEALGDFCQFVKDEAQHYAQESVARTIVDNLVSEWSKLPDQTSLSALRGIFVSHDANNHGAEPLVGGWRFSEALKDILPYRLRKTLGIEVHVPYWPEAATLLARPETAALLKLRRAVDKLWGPV